MALRFLSPARAAHQIAFSGRRHLSSTCVAYKDAATASTSTAEEKQDPTAQGSKKGSAVPSSCPEGTVLSGLSLYKDRADPVALPDSEYPPWLWGILDDLSSSTSSGAVLENTVGLSKGEARAAQKRNFKAVRAAQRGQEKKGPSGAGAGMNAVGAASDGIVEEGGELEKAQGLAAVAVQGASATSVEAERAAKKAMRKANRDNIKAKNFVSAR